MQDFLSLFSSKDFVNNDRKVSSQLRRRIVDQLAWQHLKPADQTKCGLRDLLKNKVYFENSVCFVMERRKTFTFKTPTSLMIAGPSGCGKTVFTTRLHETIRTCLEPLAILYVIAMVHGKNVLNCSSNAVSNSAKVSPTQVENAGPGSRGTGYGVRGTGSWSGGKHGVWWKTRGLSGKHGGTIFSPNNEVGILLIQIAMKINRRETRFLVIKAN